MICVRIMVFMSIGRAFSDGRCLRAGCAYMSTTLFQGWCRGFTHHGATKSRKHEGWNNRTSLKFFRQRVDTPSGRKASVTAGFSSRCLAMNYSFQLSFARAASVPSVALTMFHCNNSSLKIEPSDSDLHAIPRILRTILELGWALRNGMLTSGHSQQLQGAAFPGGKYPAQLGSADGNCSQKAL